MTKDLVEPKAIFLDKDGTLIANVPYNIDPSLIEFLPGVEEGLKMLHAHGFRFFVISNQAGVARGKFPFEALGKVEAKLRELFGHLSLPLEGVYFCPHDSEGSVEGYRKECECRKPLPGLIRRACDEHQIDPTQSWMIGDILDDVEAGRRAGCRTILIDNGNETEWRLGPERMPEHVARHFGEAARLISSQEDRRRFAAMQAANPRALKASQW